MRNSLRRLLTAISGMGYGPESAIELTQAAQVALSDSRLYAAASAAEANWGQGRLAPEDFVFLRTAVAGCPEDIDGALRALVARNALVRDICTG